MAQPAEPLADDPLWYQDAITYEVHVRAFHDSDGDGIGDFRGLTEKLDYLQDLGVTALWLLPFYPSPLRDDGYDIADYTGVHPSYGTTRHFRTFLSEAHRRGLRVITELVINHTSDEHPWFKRAVRAKPGSKHRNFYVWSGTPDKWQEARIIFQDFEHSNWTWHPGAEAYYWHRFYSHQPDLNFDNPAVMDAIERVLGYWLDLGVDGMRLDAIPYIYEREGTSCENLPETHAALKQLRAHLDKHYSNRMFLAEANQWPEDAAAYFGDGDECHMAFHFPLMPRLFMAARMEDRFPIIDILQQTPAIPEGCQWAVFLRNHDELTLEMVTDEERDYMYRTYAHEARSRLNVGIRRRLAPLLGNSRRLIELMNGLLFSMPGMPVIYYGDEIGMGDNIFLGDRNGVRTPMQWSADRNAGFSRANPQRLFLPVIIDPEYHFETVNVEAQQNNPSSLLWWMKRMIALRKQHRVFGRGSITFLYPDNPKVLAFVRELQPGSGRHAGDEERVLVVANLSRFVQAVELDLSAYKGLTPVELFGRTAFPPIGDLPYFLTLGPHAFYWFAVEHVREELTLGYRAPEDEVARAPAVAAAAYPELVTTTRWQAVLTGRDTAAFERVLPEILRTRRWFGGKARNMQQVSVVESIPIPVDGDTCYVLLVQVTYRDGEEERYVLPVAFAEEQYAERVIQDIPSAVLARLHAEDPDGRADSGVLFDALWKREFAAGLLEFVARRRRVGVPTGELQARPSRAFRELRGETPLEASVMRAEQSNTSVAYGNRFVLKLFRRLQEGVNPDLEIGRFLTERSDFRYIPPVAGSIEFRPARGGEALTVAILQGFVPNEGDAWSYTLDGLGRYYERAMSERAAHVEERLRIPARSLVDLARLDVPVEAEDFIGPYLSSAELLGRRTAEMHLALASNREDPAFTPEPFTTLYQRSLYQSMRTLARRSFQLMRRRLRVLGEGERSDAERLLKREDFVVERFQELVTAKIFSSRIRIHGDYHLGQVLNTGRDFVVIDFEGEPARSLGERRLKRSVLRDVAGMLRSFDYAAYAGLFEQIERGLVSAGEHAAELERWTRYWGTWVSATFLRAYLDALGPVSLVPRDPEVLRLLLDVYLLEKAIYELGYELNNRPTWVRIPLQGVLQLIGEEP
ncbi:MAG: maltose alpha-D-glucosyltransferase [Actinomycetota bacterium]|nr:maltose alpha-D-glucosyltransferase [Actinomycetota bacterium]